MTPRLSFLMDRLVLAIGALLCILVILMMLIPPVIVLGASVTAGETMEFPPEGFSLRWYARALESAPFMESLWISIKLGVAAMLGSLIIGLTAALAIDRYHFRGRDLLRVLALSPLIVPAVVLGIGLLQLLTALGLGQTWTGLLLGHLVITVPYVVRTLLTSLELFDRRVEEAALNLRASPVTVLRRITLPLLLPGLTAAGIFAFMISFGNVTLSIFLGFAGAETLPVRIFTFVEHSFDPTLAAVSGIVILVTVAIMLAIEWLIGFEKVL